MAYFSGAPIQLFLLLTICMSVPNVTVLCHLVTACSVHFCTNIDCRDLITTIHTAHGLNRAQVKPFTKCRLVKHLLHSTALMLRNESILGAFRTKNTLISKHTAAQTMLSTESATPSRLERSIAPPTFHAKYLPPDCITCEPLPSQYDQRGI